MSYNERQKLVINSPEPNIVITAPPGSGKTHTMTGAVEEFVSKNKIEDRLVVITFTNAAAEELKERVGFLHAKIEISTIHSWSYREMVKLSEKHQFRVRLLDESSIKDILRQFLPQYKLYERSLDYVYAHCTGMRNPDLYPGLREKYDAINDLYIQYKRDKYLYDFTDLPLYLSDTLERYDEYLDVDAIFVDEFQDVDPVQLWVFNRVNAKKKLFIGDVDQAIYQFRGATSEIFEKLDNFTEYSLNVNYRSYQDIIDFSFAMKNGALDLLELPSSYVIADRGAGGKVIYEYKPNSFLTYSNRKRAALTSGFLLEGDLSALAKEINSKEFTVLCRTNREVRAVRNLGFYNAMTIHKSKGLEFDNVIVIAFDNKTKEDENVRFVANTRAKDTLIHIQMETLERLSKITGNNVKMAF